MLGEFKCIVRTTLYSVSVLSGEFESKSIHELAEHSEVGTVYQVRALVLDLQVESPQLCTICPKNDDVIPEGWYSHTLKCCLFSGLVTNFDDVMVVNGTLMFFLLVIYTVYTHTNKQNYLNQFPIYFILKGHPSYQRGNTILHRDNTVFS